MMCVLSMVKVILLDNFQYMSCAWNLEIRCGQWQFYNFHYYNYFCCGVLFYFLLACTCHFWGGQFLCEIWSGKYNLTFVLFCNHENEFFRLPGLFVHRSRKIQWVLLSTPPCPLFPNPSLRKGLVTMKLLVPPTCCVVMWILAGTCFGTSEQILATVGLRDPWHLAVVAKPFLICIFQGNGLACMRLIPPTPICCCRLICWMAVQLYIQFAAFISMSHCQSAWNVCRALQCM